MKDRERKRAKLSTLEIRGDGGAVLSQRVRSDLRVRELLASWAAYLERHDSNIAIDVQRIECNGQALDADERLFNVPGCQHGHIALQAARKPQQEQTATEIRTHVTVTVETVRRAYAQRLGVKPESFWRVPTYMQVGQLIEDDPEKLFFETQYTTDRCNAHPVSSGCVGQPAGRELQAHEVVEKLTGFSEPVELTASRKAPSSISASPRLSLPSGARCKLIPDVLGSTPVPSHGQSRPVLIKARSCTTAGQLKMCLAEQLQLKSLDFRLWHDTDVWWSGSLGNLLGPYDYEEDEDVIIELKPEQYGC
ncbi:hypothetical protein A1Q2_05402 [Trichosporon asahii var. asahii CBS 8904]|uniref:Uncharacterized protein n=1 Tax=Trichosporon asahii var. asahii (strain CBS 8904) TaxID=1220162 RepID=K1V8E1_TRIAC|nr:hypothetical protein A1Q2_05402 [Trichosporon asahii var. asahii CBS 8904]